MVSFFAVPHEDARQETEAGEHEAVEDQAELEGVPRAQSFLGDHVEGAETDGECILKFFNHSLTLICSIFQRMKYKYHIQIDPENVSCEKKKKERKRKVLEI